MARSRLIVTTDLAGLSPVLVEGVAVSTRYERLRDSVEAKVPGAAALLAEPVLGAATPTGYKSAAWYAAAQGESLPLSEVPAQERAEAIAHLGRSLDAIVDLVSEVPFGAWLRAAFIVPTAESIRVIDGKAILVNWGFVPASLPQTDEALEKHFVDTIGTLIGWSGLPRINPARSRCRGSPRRCARRRNLPPSPRPPLPRLKPRHRCRRRRLLFRRPSDPRSWLRRRRRKGGCWVPGSPCSCWAFLSGCCC